jgi:hypothetical protein
MACNNYVNLYIFRKHFPDKLIGPDLKKVHTLLFIFSILFSLSLLIVIIAGKYGRIEKREPPSIRRKVYTGCAGSCFTKLDIHPVHANKDENFIKRENYNSLTKSISSIGSES